jgi:YD repeat-containing protein
LCTAGGQTSYVYDADGRLTKVTLADGTTSTYGYDGFGELTGASNVTETLGFGYDAAGEASTATAAPLSTADAEPSVTLAYGYDAAGEPTSVAGPAGAVGYGYNPDGLLNQVTDPSGGVFGITHDANGRRTGLSRPNGVTDVYSHAAADELLGIDSTNSGGGSVGFDHYTYTTNGLRASLANGDGTTSYGYDADAQLTSGSYPSASGLAKESFGYDSVGTRPRPRSPTTALGG